MGRVRSMERVGRGGLGLSENLKNIGKSDRLPRIIKKQGMKLSVAHRSMSLPLGGTEVETQM